MLPLGTRRDKFVVIVAKGAALLAREKVAQFVFHFVEDSAGDNSVVGVAFREHTVDGPVDQEHQRHEKGHTHPNKK